jgi:phenylacetate-coenzyme A ligase PaaK-like adenylate-forming protein
MSFIPYDLNDDKLKKIQCEGLKWTVGHAYKNSSFYKKNSTRQVYDPKISSRLKISNIFHLPIKTIYSKNILSL